MLAMEVQDAIKRWMADHDITQERVADLAQMSQSQVSEALSGKTSPRLGTLKRIADVIGLELTVKPKE